MESTRVFYFVSLSPDRIDLADEESPNHYQGPEDAGDGIVHGFHGETGTRYVIKAELTVVAEYSRPWTLVRKEADHDSEADQGPEEFSPTGTR